MFNKKSVTFSSTLNGKSIAFKREEIVVIFEVEDQVQKINGKDVLIKGHTSITIETGACYPVKEDFIFVKEEVWGK